MPLHLRFTFGTFFSRSCKSTMSNDQIIGFVENVNTQQSIFLSLFERKCRPYEFRSWAIQSSTNSTNWNNCKVVLKSANYLFFKGVFLVVAVVVVKASDCNLFDR